MSTVPQGFFDGSGHLDPLANPLGAPAADGYSLHPAWDSLAQYAPAGGVPIWKNNTLYPLWLELAFSACPAPFDSVKYFGGGSPLLFGPPVGNSQWAGGSPTAIIPVAGAGTIWWYYEQGVNTPNRTQRDLTVPISLGGGDSITGPYYALSTSNSTGSNVLTLEMIFGVSAWTGGAPWSGGTIFWSAPLGTPVSPGAAIDPAVLPGLTLEFVSQTFATSYGDFSPSSVTLAQPAH